MADFIKVAKTSEVPLGKIKKVAINGKEIALYNLNGKFYATTNICPHQGGPLDEGEMDGDTVICPWHGWMFNVTDGATVMNPRLKIQTYPVQVQGDDILLSVG